MSKPTERPVIFSAQEVNAVLAGHKTQHRVIIENTKETQCLFSRDWRYDGRDFLDDGFTPDPKGAHYVERLESSEGEERQYTEDYRCLGHCPFGVVGDRLWVQEFHARTDQNDHLTRPHYYADGTLRPDLRHDAGLLIKYSAEDMPRWASRLLIEITDIRIERVQDITGGDAYAQGCPYAPATTHHVSNQMYAYRNASSWFAENWKENHGEQSYFDNVWVWVIDFKVVEEASNG